MSTINTYNFSSNQISSILLDTSDNGYLWVAFKPSNDICLLRKTSAHNPLLTYFDVNITTNEIKKMMKKGTTLWLLVDDDDYIAKRYSSLNPLSTPANIDIPSGITEVPIDITADNSNAYILLPGNTSGTNSKICVFTLNGVFSETIDLVGITNASSFTLDDNNNIWVCTDTNPAKLIRVYDDSGWQIQTITL